VTEHNETRAGAYSGLLAAIMVVALSVMALVALEPAPVQIADASLFTHEPGAVD